MISLQPTVWIIILNWNGLEDSLACLQSLSLLDKKLAVHTLVIDNGSHSDPTTVINARFPTVEVVRLEHNLGFTGGCNEGISRAMEAHADYVLLLNNDTLVRSDFLELLVDYLTRNSHVGVVAPLICYANRPDKVWFAGGKIRLALGYFAHQHVGWDRHRLPVKPIVCDYVTGCCMLIPAAIIKTVGCLDNRLFAYFEDADFCIRVRQAGFDIVCLPASVIWHQESASTRRTLSQGTTSPLKHYLMARNRILTVRKSATRLQYIVFLLLSNTIRSNVLLMGLLFRRRWEKIVWLCRGIVDGILDRSIAGLPLHAQ